MASAPHIFSQKKKFIAMAADWEAETNGSERKVEARRFPLFINSAVS